MNWQIELEYLHEPLKTSLLSWLKIIKSKELMAKDMAIGKLSDQANF